MRTKLLLLLFVFIPILGYAQSTPSVTYTVKGTLVDSLTSESEPYATIKIVKKDAPAKAVKMAVTDTNGKFQEKITGSGDYVITITSIGKITVEKEFTLSPGSQTVDLGTLHTADATNELAGVEVVAQKPLVKVDIDKIEYNIQDDPDSQTNSILEMLRKVPLVTVDGEDNIQVNGSSSFKIHVNGKPNNMMSSNPTEVLKSMPANSIKHIEVITNPGPKYDAEGVGGILNIVTVDGKGMEGYTATFTANGSNTGAGGSIYATIKKNKFTVSGNFGYNYNDRPRSYSESERRDKDNNVLNSSSWNKNKGSFQQGNVEASYELDTLRLFTLAFGMYGGGGDSYGEGWTEMRNRYRYERRNDGDNSWYSIRGNVDYQRLFSVKDRMLTFSYRINTQPRSEDYLNKYTYDEDTPQEELDKLDLRDQRYDQETNSIEHTFQGDYTTPIGKYHTLETGLKYILRKNSSDVDYFVANSGTNNFVEDPTRSIDFDHTNNILGVYAGYALRYKKISGRLGLRYEHTDQDLDFPGNPQLTIKPYDDFVPSASIGYKLGDTKNIRLGYNKRIWRPNIFYLNPYVNTSDPTHISKGNPDLDTENGHNVNLSFSSFTQKFNINLSLRHTFINNSIERYTELREDGIMYTEPGNIAKARFSGLSGYINWNASPKTRIYMNLSLSYDSYSSEKLDMKNSGWSAFAYGGFQHTFPYDIRLSLNVMGATPNVSLQGEGYSFYDYNMSINKSFLDKRLTLNVFAGNMFNKYTTNKFEMEGIGFNQSTKSKYSRQRFGVSVSYRIGELKAQVKKAARSINNDDVKDGGGSEGGGS